MRTIKNTFPVLIITLLSFLFNNFSYGQFTMTQKSFEPNNSRTYFSNFGVFNQDINASAGYFWPASSNKSAIFTSGLTIGALINGSLRMASASYRGEYYTGYINNGVAYTDTNFRIYKVKRGDNALNNPDYANWGAMIPFGAPYVDVNSNGQYDAGIDIPGVKNAEQTIFIQLTDGFIARHDTSEGFGGGTLPLNAELTITAWGYKNVAIVEDFQFIKFRIINKNNLPWTHTYLGFIADPDLGAHYNDYIGCDTIRKLSYCYNYNNFDSVYGYNPPAVGFLLLKGLLNNNVTPSTSIDLSSFTFFDNTGYAQQAPCETDPNGELYPAYLFLKGYKKDSSVFKNPLTTPPSPTKFVYSGDPETGIGWTEYKGSVRNCASNPNPPPLTSNNPGDRRILISMGAENFTMAPNDTQTIIISQMIARGSNNKNSVTKLKALSDTVRNIYNNGFKLFNSISGNIKFQDDNQPVTSGSVKAMRLDVNTGNIIILDSAGIQPNGNYILENVPVGDVYIGAVPNSAPPVDYVLTYHPSSIYWKDAILLRPTGNLTNIDVKVMRRINITSSNNISGRVSSVNPSTALKDVNLYVKEGNNFVGYDVSLINGVYKINSLPTGNIKIIADRIGFSSDSITLTLTKNILDSVNFYLTRLYIGIKPVSNIIQDNFYLFQNYPNPFNPSTIIKFQIKESKFVTLKVYDVLGKEVAKVVNEILKPGVYEVPFSINKYSDYRFSSGIYFYKLTAGEYSETKKMVLIK